MTRRSGIKTQQRRSGLAEALDLPFKLDAARLLHPRPHSLAERLDIGGAGIAFVDEEVAVQLRHLGVAHRKPTATGRIDELPRLIAGRVLKGRAAGAALDGLHLLAIGGDLVHLRQDLLRVARRALKPVSYTH